MVVSVSINPNYLESWGLQSKRHRSKNLQRVTLKKGEREVGAFIGIGKVWGYMANRG